jgi:MFS family permease
MSAPAPPLDSANNRIIAAAILLVVMVGVGLSMLAPLLSVALEKQGISAFASSLSASAGGLGTIAAVAVLGRLTRAMGVAVVLGLAILVSTLATLAFPATQGLAIWTGLRFLLGAGIGVVFTLSEFWINVAAPPERRGFVMGLYATMLYAGFAVGPLVLANTIGEGAGGVATTPFLLAAAIMVSGLLPLSLVGKTAPDLEDKPSQSPLRILRIAPAATMGALIFGVVETGAMLLLPVHALRLGYEASGSAWLVAAFTLGNVALQIPVGLMADRVPRLPLLAALALASAAALLGLMAVQHPYATAGLLFLAGGISGGIYPVALALLGERFTGADLAAANGAVVALYSLGFVVGPPVVGLMMDRLGATGLPLGIGGLLVAYGLFVLAGQKKAQGNP